MIGRALKIVWISQFVLLVALGVWFRVTSLKNLPGVLGDEAYFGFQTLQLLHGRPVTWLTPTGNPINPVLIAAGLPLHLLFSPSTLLLRVPAVVSGLTTVVLLSLLGSRVLDRSTARIAALLMAVLPVAVIFSRVGIEMSQTPLVTLLALYFAFRTQGLALGLAFIGAVLVHPTNVFLLPALVAVYLARTLPERWGDPARVGRLLLGTLVATVAVVALVGTLFLGRGGANGYYQSNDRTQNWVLFGTQFVRFLIFDVEDAPLGWKGPLAAIIAGVLLTAGSWRLAQQRQWDRLALVAGLITSAAGLHLVAGPHVLTGWTGRYGAFLLVPLVLSVGCLLHALLEHPVLQRRPSVWSLVVIALLGATWPLAFETDRNWFIYFTGPGRESIWTFRTEVNDPATQIASVLRRDLAWSSQVTPNERPSQIVPVVCSDYQSHQVTRYFGYLLPHIRPEFVPTAEFYPDLTFLQAKIDVQIRDALRAGGYVVMPANAQAIQRVESLCAPAPLLSRTIRNEYDHSAFVVQRLTPPEPRANSTSGFRAKVDLATQPRRVRTGIGIE